MQAVNQAKRGSRVGAAADPPGGIETSRKGRLRAGSRAAAQGDPAQPDDPNAYISLGVVLKTTRTTC